MTTPVPLPLRLLPAPASAGEAAAWLLPGDDAGAWLKEIVRWGVPLAGVKLMPLPASATDSSAVAAMAICASRPAVAPGARALPFAAIAPGIFVPAGSAFSPPVTGEELRRRVVWPFAVLHPGLGWVGCREEELIDVIALLDGGVEQARAWSPIPPGVSAGRRVNSVRPEVTPGLDAVMHLIGGDLGQLPPDELPTLPEESAGRRLIDGAKKKLADAVGGMAGGAGDGSLIGRLAGWAKRQSAALSANLEAARAKELARLMRLLESDPDQGLRYALPLTGDESRGKAPPAGRLGVRDTSFSLGRLFGSAPGDAWAIREDMQRRLRQRYLQLAARELGLRRFGRAAYVFANLLGDYASAANALEQGRLWREAATLYTEKLRDSGRAAECLERGGLLDEAIELYLTLHRHEKVGDLYTQLGRPADAAAAYRTAVRQLTAGDNLIDAARLLENALGVPDEALDVLTNAWPHSRQATPCAKAAFDLLARLGRHDEAGRRAVAIRTNARETRLAHRLADVAAHVACGYPAGVVRAAAEDAVRVVVGHALPNVTADEAKALLAHVTRASGHDRLLGRDAQRYLAGHTSKRPPTPVAVPAKGSVAPRELRRIALPDAEHWETFVAVPNGFVALGVDGGDVLIARGTWDGPVQSIRFLCRAVALSGGPRLLVQGRSIYVYRIGANGLFPEQTLPATNAFPQYTVCGVPAEGNGYTAGLAASDNGLLHWIGRAGDDVGLVQRTFADGRLIDTRPCEVELPPDVKPLSQHYLAQADAQVFTAGDRLYLLRRERPALAIELPDAVFRMTGQGVSHAAVRVTVDFDDGAALVRPLGGVVERFANGLVNPTTRLLPDNTLVAADKHEGRIYELIEQKPHLRAKFKPPAGIAAWLPTDAPSQFAAITSDGQVIVYERR